MYRRTPEGEPERRTSPLALRISILTGLAVAIFAVLFLRLWYVQILSGDKYRTQANDNRIREVRVQAPRGDILDRNGKVMVANRTELAVEVNPEDLPEPGPTRSREMHQLATVTVGEQGLVARVGHRHARQHHGGQEQDPEDDSGDRRRASGTPEGGRQDRTVGAHRSTSPSGTGTA